MVGEEAVNVELNFEVVWVLCRVVVYYLLKPFHLFGKFCSGLVLFLTLYIPI